MSSQQAAIQFTYPRSAESSFNLDHYMHKHIPLVGNCWGEHGMRSWFVIVGDNNASYHVQTTFFWDSLEAFEKVDKTVVMDDVKNFSKVEASTQFGMVAGQGTYGIGGFTYLEV